MEIFKVGDEISISGYKAITLSDDMQKNVSKFAEVNGVGLTEAERILNAVPGIKEFAASIYTDDVDEDIVITDTDFTLEDNEFDVSKVKGAQKVSAANDAQKTGSIKFADDVVPATPSSDNPTNLKDLLGIFGFDAANSNAIYKPEINGFELDGKTYSVILDGNGVITATKITDANGKETIGVYPFNQRDAWLQEIKSDENALIALIKPLIKAMCVPFTSEKEEKMRNAIIECVESHEHGTSAQNMPTYIKMALTHAGFDTSKLDNEYKSFTDIFTQIKELCTKLCDTFDKVIEYDKEEAKYTTETVNKGGVNFKVKYLTGDGSCSITEKDGKIIIDGKNCTVDLLGYGAKDKEIIVNGSGVTLNSNALTLESITNNAKNSTINGSFGNDSIINNPNADNCIINAGDSDDDILNYAKNTKINGEGGNDTIANYGEGAVIDGGTGDDSINYVDGTAEIIPSEGNDTEHKIQMRGFPSDDPDYKFFREFTVNGVTFQAYSNEDNFDTVQTSFYKNLLTINVSDMKIVVTKANDNSAVKLQGSDVKFYSNVTLKSVFNYADNSQINGSTGDDYLYNYSQNTGVNGGDGDDALINAGDKSTINGGSGADRIYNRDEGTNSTIINDPKDKIYNGNASTQQKITKGDKSDKDYNMEVTMAYITSAMRGNPEPSAPDASKSVIDRIKLLLAELINTDKDGIKSYTALARQIIQAAKDDLASKTDSPKITDSALLLEYGLKAIDTNSDGVVSEEELQAFKDANDKKIQEQQQKAELDKVQKEVAAKVGLSATQMEEFINSCGSTADALAKLKQIQVIINIGVNSSSNKSYSMTNIKEMMTSSTVNFNNEILADAQILVDAENAQEGKDAYIKSKMITDGSNMSLTEMASKTQAGEVVEKAGKLYVNDSGKMVELDISAETYLKLFPPVERFFVEQNGYNDCFFIATSMIEAMENPAARAKLLQVFKEDGSGNISVTFPGMPSYPITFENGELKTTDAQWTEGGKTYSYNSSGKVQDGTSGKKSPTSTQGSLGLAMLEQAYALAKFAEISNSNLSSAEITEIYNKEVADAVKTDGKVTDASSTDMDKALMVFLDGGFATEALDDIFGTTNNGSDKYKEFKGLSTAQKESLMSSIYANSLTSNALLTTLISGGVEISSDDAAKYNIIPGHQYAIESINPQSKTVTIKNPWDSYKTTEIPYDVFFKYFYGVLARTID